jgi:hypothetical protein
VADTWQRLNWIDGCVDADRAAELLGRATAGLDGFVAPRGTTSGARVSQASSRGSPTSA